jgi:hypothetical protein
VHRHRDGGGGGVNGRCCYFLPKRIDAISSYFHKRQKKGKNLCEP